MIDYFTDWCRAPAAASAYILTHCHSDHMTGLYEGWRIAPLICSPTTARLLRSRHGIRDTVRPLELGVPLDVDGVTITLIDANHIPGSVMVIIRRAGGAVVHTGDFRLCKEMLQSEELLQVAGEVEYFFYDNSWDAQWFPTVEESIEHVKTLIEDHQGEDIVIQSSMGDEAILEAVASRRSASAWQIWCDQRFAELKETNAHFLNGLGQRTFAEGAEGAPRVHIVRNSQQRRRLDLRGLVIQCSILWFFRHDKNLEPCFDGEVWHVPFSMHSSGAERKKLQSLLKPTTATPICDVIYKSEDFDPEYEESVPETQEETESQRIQREEEERETNRVLHAVSKSAAFYRAAVSPYASESEDTQESQGKPHELLELLDPAISEPEFQAEPDLPQQKRAKRS